MFKKISNQKNTKKILAKDYSSQERSSKSQEISQKNLKKDHRVNNKF